MTDQIAKQQPASADHAKYTVHGRVEIASILSALCKAGSTLTAYIDGVTDDFILTSILTIKPEQDCVLLDFGANDDANRRALICSKIVCITVLDGIRIQMSCQAFRPARFEDRKVFSMAMPETLLRLQRREYYRVGTPRIKPLVCTMAAREGSMAAAPSLVIVNISCGGISVVDSDATENLETGTRLRGCRIAFPDLGEVITDVLIRGSVEVTFHNGVKHRRSGWEFIGMRERERSLIQRYINRLEHEHRHRGVTE